MSVILNIDEIRSLPIADVVGEYVTLRKAGTRQVACCPFHAEKSPSFGVHPAKNIFKCFGCGAAGDGIEFVMRHENLSFLDAVERIAKDQGVNLQYDKNADFDAEKAKMEEARKEREALHLVQEWAARTYFSRNFGSPAAASPLPSGEGKGVGLPAGDSFNWGTISLDGRHLSWSTIRDFELSFAGDDWGFIRKESTKEGWGLDALLRTGLLKEGRENTGTYDAFATRYLFPIRDHRGKVAGFGARLPRDIEKAPGNERPKYINSPETPAYNKSELLYGLWQNRRAIGKEKVDYARNEGFAYIVEGYMDVVTMYDQGIRNAVAPCGTSLTDQQIDLLARHTDEVVLCFDADKAGEAATERSVERLLQKGFKVQILFLDIPNEKHDPDSFLRKFGLTSPVHRQTTVKDPETKQERIIVAQVDDLGWAGRMRKSLQDAIYWMVTKGFNPADPHSKAEAIETAARLLGYLDSDMLRSRYIESFCQKGILGNVKRDLKDAIAERRDEVLRKNRYKFTREQEQDRLRYGIYVEAKKFWMAQGDGEGWELTNFVVEPLMVVIGNNKSLRLVRIVNEDGMSATIEMDSDDIVELSTFKKVVARKGNFVFKASCKAEHFARIQAKIMAETPNVYPIYTMGMHEREDGSTFYAYANGIFTPDGFQEVNEFGAVKIGDITYYLPAFSRVRVGSLGEQTTESFEDIKPYFYPPKVKEISVREWSQRIRQVFGKNGIVGASWALAAIHRDIIFRRFKMFPHLNLFGVPQSGKNQLAGSLQALFGLPQPPIGLENATKAAMTRLISVIRNGVVWFDEYKNDVDRWVVELLKGFADGTSRRKGDANMEMRTVSTPVNSAAIISGQHQLTLDIAMFSRTISLNFSQVTFSEAERQALRELKDIEETGALTRIAAQVHGHRQLFLDKFSNEFEFVRTDFSAAFPAGVVVSDRVLNMFCIPLTSVRLLAGAGVDIAYTYDDLKQALLDLALIQKESMFAENETSIWWRIIEFLLERRELRHGHDIIVEYADRETYDEDWSGKRQRSEHYADHTGSGAIKLVYLYFGVAHPLYMKQHFDERKVKGLDKQALFLYLRSSDAYAGLKRAKKFAGKPKSCMVFFADKLPFELPLTIEVLARESRKEEEPTAPPAPAAASSATQPASSDDPPF